MNLKSCDNCGVVIDLDKRKLPDDIYGDDGCVDKTLGTYSQVQGRWVPYVKCPVCGEPIEGDPL